MPLYLIDVISIRAIHLNRMRRRFRIQVERSVQMFRNEIGINLPLREDSIQSQPKETPSEHDRTNLSEKSKGITNKM